MTRTLALAALLAAFALPAAAAPDDYAEAGRTAARAEMAKLGGLRGSWKGSGWIEVPQAGRIAFTSEETVTERLGGSAYLVEGLHRDAKSGAVVHHALGLLFWDVPGRSYRMATALDMGRGGFFPGKLEGNRFTWAIDIPRGPKQRYVIAIEGDRWVETGERSTDGGASWTPFFHMELQRAK